jgi:Cytochrome b(N-terminal)/b6/petB
MPGKGRANENVVGAPMYPYFMAKTGAFFFFTFAALALAATFTQINPIWLYGPHNPVAMSADSQPDFYMGALEGGDHTGPERCGIVVALIELQPPPTAHCHARPVPSPCPRRQARTSRPWAPSAGTVPR